MGIHVAHCSHTTCKQLSVEALMSPDKATFATVWQRCKMSVVLIMQSCFWCALGSASHAHTATLELLRCPLLKGVSACIEQWRHGLGSQDKFMLGVVEGDAEQCLLDAASWHPQAIAPSLSTLTCGVPTMCSLELLHLMWAFRRACLGVNKERSRHCDLEIVLAEIALLRKRYQLTSVYNVSGISLQLATSVQACIDKYNTLVWSSKLNSIMSMVSGIDSIFIETLTELVLQLGFGRRLLQWCSNSLAAVSEYNLEPYIPLISVHFQYFPSRMELLLQLLGGPHCMPPPEEGVCEHRPLRFVEIGVHMGRLSFPLLSFLPSLSYIGVDPYTYGNQTSQGSVDKQLRDLGHTGANDVDGLQAARRAAEEKYRYFGARAQLWVMPSLEAANQVQDGSVDGVFIDGDHSYAAVVQDVKAWEPKIRPGGFLSGHDFANHADVAKAVLEHASHHARLVHLAMDWVWFWHIP